MKRGDHEEAIALYDICLAADYNPAQTNYNKGKALYSLNRLSEALTCFQDAAKHSPHWAACHWNMAVVLEELTRWGEANEAWKRFLELSPKAPERQEIEARMARNKRRMSR